MPFTIFLEHPANVILKPPSATFSICNICGSVSIVPFPLVLFLGMPGDF